MFLLYNYNVYVALLFVAYGPQKHTSSPEIWATKDVLEYSNIENSSVQYFEFSNCMYIMIHKKLNILWN